MPEQPRGDDRHDSDSGLDREISLRGLALFAAGLTATALVVFAASLWVFRAELGRSEAADPAPPPIAESHLNLPPPEPRLQTDPEEELEAMRRADAEHLTTYGWVDREAGVVRVPIERGIELFLADQASAEVRP